MLFSGAYAGLIVHHLSCNEKFHLDESFVEKLIDFITNDECVKNTSLDIMFPAQRTVAALFSQEHFVIDEKLVLLILEKTPSVLKNAAVPYRKEFLWCLCNVVASMESDLSIYDIREIVLSLKTTIDDSMCDQVVKFGIQALMNLKMKRVIGIDLILTEIKEKHGAVKFRETWPADLLEEFLKLFV